MRKMVNMLRHENMSVVEVANALHRSPLAVHYRIDKVLTEHMGENDVSLLEASNWLHPHISARDDVGDLQVLHRRLQRKDGHSRQALSGHVHHCATGTNLIGQECPQSHCGVKVTA
jgi:hypothetical protein